jgi:hypothetical protein
MAVEVPLRLTVRAGEGICTFNIRWLFTRRGEEGQPPFALHPGRNSDDYHKVTFLAEATRSAVVIDTF